MYKLSGVLILLAFTLLAPRPASAGKAFFGQQDEIHEIVNVEVTDQNNRKLYLGHRVTMYFFFAGVYVKDQGYVLGVRNDSKTYYDMPGVTEVERLQKAGLLPNPLPPYRVPLIDWLLGLSLWICIAGMLLWHLLKHAIVTFRTRSQHQPVSVT
jgi:hypothetical protein